MRYEVIGWWGGEKVVVGSYTRLRDAVAAWLSNVHTAIYTDQGRLVPIVRVHGSNYRIKR